MKSRTVLWIVTQLINNILSNLFKKFQSITSIDMKNKIQLNTFFYPFSCYKLVGYKFSETGIHSKRPHSSWLQIEQKRIVQGSTEKLSQRKKASRIRAYELIAGSSSNCPRRLAEGNNKYYQFLNKLIVSLKFCILGSRNFEILDEVVVCSETRSSTNL